MSTSNETMRVNIPAMQEHGGYPGNVITADISIYCPVCGGRRGKPYKTISYDGSRRLHVDGWDNPCGHRDLYSKVREEIAANIKEHESEQEAQEKTIKYKVWMQIEEMYLDKDGVEQHRNVKGEDVKYGEFETIDQAHTAMKNLEFEGGLLPN